MWVDVAAIKLFDAGDSVVDEVLVFVAVEVAVLVAAGLCHSLPTLSGVYIGHAAAAAANGILVGLS